MDWTRDGTNWPNRIHSRFANTRPHRWHVQDTGSPGDGRPVILLLHGAGAATHSWRHMLPLLDTRARVIAPDLPGQGFSRSGSRFRLGMDFIAEDMARLLGELDALPDAIVGHSAGGALGLWLAHRLERKPAAAITVNGALEPFPGMAGWLFPDLARLLSLNPLTALVVSRTGASEASVRSLLENTGSRIDAEGLACYRRLVASRAHVDGTLGMMAQWRLEPLLAALPRIALPTLFLAAENDRTVPPEIAYRSAARMPQAEVVAMPARGHLVHEEAAQDVAAAVFAFLDRQGIAIEPDRREGASAS